VFSAPRENGLVFFVEGRHAFSSVLGVDQKVVGFDLKTERSAEFHLNAVADGFFDLPH
jgi:hypothetical protein